MADRLLSRLNKSGNWVNRSTQRRLVIWSVGFWLVSILIISAIVFFVGQNRILNETRARNIQFASTISRDVNAEISGITGNARTFTRHLAALGPDPETQAGALLGLRLSSNSCKALYYFAANNTLMFDLSDTAQNLGSKTPGEIIKRQVLPVRSEILEIYGETLKTGVSISDLYYSPLDYAPVIDIGMPVVFSSGERKVLVFEADLEDIWQKINTATIGQTGVTYAVSHQGKVIAHPDASFLGRQIPGELSPVLDNYEGSSEFLDPFTKQDVIAAYSPVGGQTGWGIIVQQNKAEINASVVKTGSTIIFVLLILAVIGTASILFLIGGFMKPIKELTRTTENIASTGNLTKTQMERRPDEIGQLSRAFDMMIDKVKETEGELSVSEERYRSLFEHANDSILLIGEGGIIDCNNKAEEMFAARRDQIINRLPSAISPEKQPDGSLSRDKEEELIDKAFAGIEQRFEWRHCRFNGELFDTEVCLNRLNINNKFILMGIIRDITDRKQAEEALKRSYDELENRVAQRTSELQTANSLLRREINQRLATEHLLQESETKYRELVENSASIILEMDTSGNITFLNRYAQEFFGFTEEEIMGRNVVGTIVPPIDSYGENVAEKISDLVKRPEFYEANENENMKKNGERVWIAWTNRGIYDPSGKLKEIHCIGIDRTAQVKMAASQAQKNKEEAAAAERTRLARDLHDAVSQTLFSTSIIAEVLPKLWEKNPDEGHRRLEEIRQLTRGALAEMRTLLFELRPASLADAELGYLLHQLSESITGRSRIPVDVLVEGECDLPPEVKVAFYRITQEALNNVAKHANAGHAHVKLSCKTDEVSLSISDDGTGFDINEVQGGSLGLGIMRERAKGIGAELKIDSRTGEGSKIEVILKNYKNEVKNDE
jgi:PAS domain S-box-containing protein